MSEQKVRMAVFPEETVNTLKCGVTGEQIPAVLVARLSPTLGYVYCPACSGKRGRAKRVWHQVDLLP